MGTIRDIEDTIHDCWVLYNPETQKETGEFDGEWSAKKYLEESPDLIKRGFRIAFKRIKYEVHSLD